MPTKPVKRTCEVTDIYCSKEGNAQSFLSAYMYKLGLIPIFS